MEVIPLMLDEVTEGTRLKPFRVGWNSQVWVTSLNMPKKDQLLTEEPIHPWNPLPRAVLPTGTC